MHRTHLAAAAAALAVTLGAAACTPDTPVAPSPTASPSGSGTATPGPSASPSPGEDSTQTGDGINGHLPDFPTTMDQLVAEPKGVARTPGKTGKADFITDWAGVDRELGKIQPLPAQPTAADWDRLHQQIAYVNAWPAWKVRKPLDAGYVVAQSDQTNPYTGEPVKVDGQMNIEIILDASGSMANDAGGMNREEAAKKAIDDLLATLPPTAKVGVRVYGHQGSNSEADKATSCAANELVHPIAALDKDGIHNAIAGVQPTGWTPIAGSFDAAATDLAGFTGPTDVNAVYLISDGIETCDGDPVAAAKQLTGSAAKPHLGVIGFGVDASQGAQLKEITDAVGGYYGNADDAGTLAEQLKTVTVYNPAYAFAPLTQEQLDKLQTAQQLAATFAGVDGGKCGVVESADYAKMLEHLETLGKITAAQRSDAPNHNRRCSQILKIKSDYGTSLTTEQNDWMAKWKGLVGQQAVVIYPDGTTPRPRQ